MEREKKKLSEKKRHGGEANVAVSQTVPSPIQPLSYLTSLHTVSVILKNG